MRNQKTHMMAQTAILASIILVLSFTPIGYPKIGILEFTFFSIPVVIGAMFIGTGSSTILGVLFGLTSFMTCITGQSSFGATLLAINPFFCAVVCIIPRTLMGYLSGVIFKWLYKYDKKKLWSYITTAFLGAAMNTLFFTTALILLFGNSDYIMNMRSGLGVLAFAVAFVGLNGIIEAIICTIAGGSISKALSKITHRE